LTTQGNVFKGNKSGYSHLLCFYALPVPSVVAMESVPVDENNSERKSKIKRIHAPKSNIYPDVLTNRGRKIWPRAMGLQACAFLMKYLKTQLKLNSELYPTEASEDDSAITNAATASHL